MALRATHLSNDPIDYFLQSTDEGPRLRVADVVLRVNQKPTEIFSRLIRMATNSAWSHSALLYLINDPTQGFDNIFLVEAMTSGVRVASWRNEVDPPEEFTVGIRRLPLDWYAETPEDVVMRNANKQDGVQGIAYLRHVHGLALDQVNQLYSHNTVDQLSALYIERITKRYHIPFLPALSADIANYFKMRDESALRFICSGLVQYSFLEALRIRISNDMRVPEYRDSAINNLNNMHRVIFHPDPDGVITSYVQQVQAGKVNVADHFPDSVTDLLKTTTPADINNTSNLTWRYIIRNGWTWRIDNDAPEGYTPQSADERTVLALIGPEHASQK